MGDNKALKASSLHLGDIETPLGNAPVKLFVGQNGIYSQLTLTDEVSPELSLPEGQFVEGLKLYSLLFSGPSQSCTISLDVSSLDKSSSWPESGERFESWRIENGAFQMNIGTRDGVALNSLYPARHRKPDDGFEWVTTKCNSGELLIEVPELQNGESVTLYFSAAWKWDANDEDVSTWSAADMALP